MRPRAHRRSSWPPLNNTFKEEKKTQTQKDAFKHCTQVIKPTHITKNVKFSLSAHSSLLAWLSVKVKSGTMFTRQAVTRGCVRCVSLALYLEQLQRRNVECWDSAEWGERSGLTPIKRDFDRGVYGSRVKEGEGRQSRESDSISEKTNSF